MMIAAVPKTVSQMMGRTPRLAAFSLLTARKLACQPDKALDWAGPIPECNPMERAVTMGKAAARHRGPLVKGMTKPAISLPEIILVGVASTDTPIPQLPLQTCPACTTVLPRSDNRLFPAQVASGSTGPPDLGPCRLDTFRRRRASFPA